MNWLTESLLQAALALVCMGVLAAMGWGYLSLKRRWER